MNQLKTFNLSQQKDYQFSKQLLDTLYPDMTQRIQSAVMALAGTMLNHDLEISLPRLEAFDLGQADLSSATDEESLSGQLRNYLNLVGRFNNYVGQSIEELIGIQLNQSRLLWTDDPNLMFVRNAVQFPDLYLVDVRQKCFLLSIEVKSWFVFATDNIKARFEAAPNIMKSDSLLILFPWYMSKLIAGVPILLQPFIGNAKALAERRDQIWLAGGLRQFQQGLVSAKRQIETPPLEVAALNKTKTKSVAYQRNGAIFEKESENFGKIWRIYDPQINAIFYPQTLEQRILNKSIATWRKDLGIDK